MLTRGFGALDHLLIFELSTNLLHWCCVRSRCVWIFAVGPHLVGCFLHDLHGSPLMKWHTCCYAACCLSAGGGVGGMGWRGALAFTFDQLERLPRQLHTLYMANSQLVCCLQDFPHRIQPKTKNVGGAITFSKENSDASSFMNCGTCWYAVCWLWGVRGGCGVGDVKTFLIVRSWWLTFRELT